MTVAKRDIIDGMECLGVRQGDCLCAHSSLKSFGHVDGGARSEDKNGDLLPLKAGGAEIWTGAILAQDCRVKYFTCIG